jgi:hypothetical protein
MSRTSRLVLVLTVLGRALLAPAGGHAREPAPAADPKAPAAPVPYDPLPNFPHPPDEPRSLFQEAPPRPPYACAELERPYFERDPLLDPPQLPSPGWFATVDAVLGVPHVKNFVSVPVTNPAGNIDTVRLPSAPLDWTVSPRFAAGYRLPSAFGEVALAYRFLTSEGAGEFAGPNGPALLKSRLTINQVELNYYSREFSLWPHWDMKWGAGLRLVYVYFDSRADQPFDFAAATSGVFEQRTSNSWWGLGPHVGVELERRVEGTGLAFFTRVDGGTHLGRIRQGGFEVFTTPGPDGRPLTAEARNSGSQDVPILTVEAGVRWQPRNWTYQDFHVFLGYQYEYWWNVGRLSTTPDSRGELSDQGILLRAEFNF